MSLQLQPCTVGRGIPAGSMTFHTSKRQNWQSGQSRQRKRANKIEQYFKINTVLVMATVYGTGIVFTMQSLWSPLTRLGSLVGAHAIG